MMTLEHIPTIEGEEWKPIKGFEYYFISNKGRVLSLRRLSTAKLLRPQIQTWGYEQVKLMKIDPSTGMKKPYNRTIHRLVAVHFVEGYEESLFVRHKNGNVLDNVADNLMWVNASERRVPYSKLTSSS